MFDPVATYRLQFHRGFSFQDAEGIIDYLARLGVSTVYASPVLTSIPGSMHGYDGLDPLEVDPELGGEEGLRSLITALKESGISWIQDIVPNHMAFHPGNKYLMDLLEKGRHSPYAKYFDLFDDHNKLMVPFLGTDLETVLKEGSLQLVRKGPRLFLNLHGDDYPAGLSSYAFVWQSADPTPPLKEWVNSLHTLEGLSAADLDHQWEDLLQRSAEFLTDKKTADWLDKRIAAFKSDTGMMQDLLDLQSYRFCHWKETERDINYRRFFTVNGLICLNIQEPEVFDWYHRKIKTFLEEGLFQGLRVDHIDGLYDPAGYLASLRRLAGDGTYIVVEKILEAQEELQQSWPVQGNTGYDFLAHVNNLFTNPDAAAAFTQFYNRLSRDHRTVAQQQRDCKALILYENMAGELDHLCRLFRECLPEEKINTIDASDMREAIGAFLIHTPVYRFYSEHLPLSDEDARAVRKALSALRQTQPRLGPAVALMEEVFFDDLPEFREQCIHFFRRCMQFSGPLMAKGVEDTLMYRYNRFIAHNEVGDAVDAFGMELLSFHHLMERRQEHFPYTLNATSTHDTKRGEDVRARLHVLSDMPQAWLQKVRHWQQMNEAIKVQGAPDAIDEYFIYQTIIGAHPMPGMPDDDFPDRLKAYLVKALREAKRRSGWSDPDEVYEQGCIDFAMALLKPKTPFRKSFDHFFREVCELGIFNSLSQLLIKFTAAGIPDMYQGTELWDLSLVDPDNRRPVNFALRNKMLLDLGAAGVDANDLKELWKHRFDGRIKLWLTQRLLQLVKKDRRLLTEGTYIPLLTEGAHKDKLIAYARRWQRQWFIVVLPLHAGAMDFSDLPATRIDWRDTRVILPDGMMPEYEHLLSGNKSNASGELPVAEIFADLPFALIRMEGEANERKAGLLLHLSSLSTPFGIGDMGPAARSFAQFLYRSHQHYWQLLPLNPVEPGQGYSPYSATSAWAGNTLFISPEDLLQEGLLLAEELEAVQLPAALTTDHAAAEKVRSGLLQKAWLRYREKGHEEMKQACAAYCREQESWLKDYALYAAAKKLNEAKPWYQWPAGLRLRNAAAIETLEREQSEELERICWEQFLFHRQWKALRRYCHSLGIQLIGDIPFYVSYDSSDVWANRHLFHVDRSGELLAMAGVPPDAFSEDGQLWGMPVFNWEKHRQEDYRWWISRLKRNTELFDLVRLDHFRAFAAYWEVPAGDDTARNGCWQPGPGAAFFEKVAEELGHLPFVAEDLGDIDHTVRTIRDVFGLPGMKVLQFAFGSDDGHSEYLPHNYGTNFIVYTGTHDNNTTRGWFEEEIDEDTRQRAMAYTGCTGRGAEIARWMAQTAYGSVANTVIIPVQDLLCLDGNARMNRPSSTEGNWNWQLMPGQLSRKEEQLLKEWTRLYNRR